ncbi:MAG: 4Fe-4S dicluster domain-containing protein [Clostridiales bacterium]|nr:4Fe-4S dicluster domain-containing protein [Clostridiales bacterium]
MKIITDALSSVAKISYKTSEYSAIYPITPSSNIGEQVSLKSERGEKNLFGNNVKVDIMQSELGAISSSFGALNSGLYSTTFTSSQGLLLMIPNMYKMASSLKPFVLTVASRSLSTHALNIFCDHSDIYATRQTGFTMLCSRNNQMVEDFALLANMITLKSKIPVMHFFDGFITSHKIDTIEELSDNNILNLFPFKEFQDFKQTSLTNINPKTLGTNQNQDAFFENREAISSYYEKLPNVINECFNEFYKETDRKYNVFDYYGSETATKIIVCMGSSVETVIESLNYLNDDYGVISVNVFNPFIKEEFLKVLPKNTKTITVLDRTKECGSIYEPLALNVIASLKDTNIKVLAGRYGLGGKDFNVKMALSIFKNMEYSQVDHFTIGINDDILNTSLKVENVDIKNDNIFKVITYGVGNDGSVSATKNAIKIIGSLTGNYVSGNFYYDSKKSGNLTQSEMLICKDKININYKLNSYDFVIVNDVNLLYNYPLIDTINNNATILINTNKNLDEAFNNEIKYKIANKNCKIFILDAQKIAKEQNLGNKINLIMLAGMFNLLDFIDYDDAISKLKLESKKQYNIESNYLDEIATFVKRYLYSNEWKNLKVTLNELKEIKVSDFKANGEFLNENFGQHFINSLKADCDNNKCIRCTNCALICPHSAINLKLVDIKELINAPIDFKYIKLKNDQAFCLNIDTNKCTGCGNCVKMCPSKALHLSDYLNSNTEFFNSLTNLSKQENNIKDLAFKEDYYSNCISCTGCCETIYYKLLGKLFGEHLVYSNATGCSSIYNGDSSCSPFIKNKNNLGTSFVSNLFEDNFEFGYGLTEGYKLSRKNYFDNLNINLLSEKFKQEAQNILENYENFEICKNAYINMCKLTSENEFDENFKNSNFLMPLVHFIVGGDGWAYDIDFSGLDHIVASNKNVNILILDNEVYSNTGGQSSKATGYGAKTKYTNSKNYKKKDLFLSLMQYDNLYFAKVCLGANKNQCINSLIDAVNHNGPSVIVAYSPCLNHKIKMENSLQESINAVKSGYFNLLTFKNKTLTLDSTPNFDYLNDFILGEGRYSNITEETFQQILKQKQDEFEFYKKLSTILK